MDHGLHVGNPPDAPLLVPAVARVIARFGQTSRTVTADRGYGEAAVFRRWILPRRLHGAHLAGPVLLPFFTQTTGSRRNRTDEYSVEVFGPAAVAEERAEPVVTYLRPGQVDPTDLPLTAH